MIAVGPAVTTAEERARLLVEWNDTRRDFPREAHLWDLFAAVAARTPEAPALEMGGEEITYADLARRATELAGRLCAAGVAPESAVALYCDRTAALVVGMLGILKAGGFYVPLDPAHPQERQVWALRNAGAAVLVTREGLDVPAELAGEMAVVVEGPHPRPLSRERERGEGLPGNPGHLHPSPAGGRGAGGEGLACAIYTSGSTGRPKGVALAHHGVARLVLNTSYARFGPHIRMAQISTPAFDAATLEVWGTLLGGGCLVGIDSDALLDPRLLVQALHEKRINAAVLTSAVFHQVAREMPKALASLDQLWVGGEAIDPTAARLVLGSAPPRRLVNAYGPTECTTLAVCGDIEAVPEEARSIPIGRPISNTIARILSPDLELVKAGVEGELCLGGDGLARCYLGRPDLTAERFIPDPYAGAPGERLYRTGDLARWLPDGTIDFLGRLDNQVKIRGFRVEPAEIEAVLCSHPRVREAAVLPVEAGPGDRRLAAFVAGQGGPAPEAAELRSFLRERLPGPMVPSLFIAREALPLNANGKVDRKVLAAEVLPVPAAVDEERSALPRTPQEEILAGLWAEVLGLPRVGIRDDFFDLGGHSLLVNQVLSRIRRTFGVDLPPRALFEARTVESFAAQLAAPDQSAAARPLAAGPRPESLPLSFAQQRLWIVERLGIAPGVYNIPVAYAIDGRLDREALARALAEVVRRHEALRTVFVEDGGEAVQSILPAGDVPLPWTDLRSCADPEAEARRLCEEEARSGFDLVRGPVLRARLLRTGEERWILLVNVHHIAADGWSMGLFAEELSALYAGGELPELPVQYADYALWQRERLGGPELERLLGYWRDRLAGLEVLDLPTDRPLPETQSFAGGLSREPLPAGIGERLAEVSRRLGATRFMAGLAAFAALLARATGCEDIAVLTATANRDRLEIERLIGFFVNTLVLRVGVDGAPSFADLVLRVRDTLLEAAAHQDLPFERLVEELRPERRPGQMPFARVSFLLEGTVPAPCLPGAAVGAMQIPTGLVKADLGATLREEESGWVLALEHAEALFDHPSVQRMAAHLSILLQGALENPDLRLDELPLLSAAEREQILGQWSDTRAPYPRDATLAGLFLAAEARHPEAVALEVDGLEISYAELGRRARRLAGRLRALGIGPEEVVAVFLDRSVELYEAIVAVTLAGGAYLTLDIETPPDRAAWVVASSGARVLLSSRELAVRLPDLELPRIELGEGEDLKDVKDSKDEEVPSLASAENLAALFYTSGSTGRPKGVLITHRCVVRLLMDRDYLRVGPGDRIAHANKVSFDPSLLEVWGAFTHGARVVAIDRRSLLSPRTLEEMLQSQRISFIILTSAIFHQAATERPGALRTLRTLMVGGEAVEARAAREILAAGPPGEILNCYGPTESTTTATWERILEVPDGAVGVPIGRPVRNTTAWVLDRWNQPAAVGIPGELCLGGDGLARGYRGRPDLTAERFVPAPFSGEPGGRLYRTGDLARWLPDGRLEFQGRTDHQVKIRGYRIEPGEIEHVLTEHAAVREAVVVPYEIRPGDRRLAAYVTPSGEEPLDPVALRDHLKRRLPDFMIPAAIVSLETLPLTPHLKVDLKSLPKPEAGTGPRTADPQTEAERQVAAVWCDLLGLPRVGIDDNFFDLGGHSLLLTRVEAQLRDLFGRPLDLVDLFRYPDIRSLARFLEGEGGETGEAAARADKMRTGRDRLRERGLKRKGRV